MSHRARGGDVGTGQGASGTGALCAEARGRRQAVTGFSPGCSAGPA